MQLISSRTFPFIDPDSLAAGLTREALLRDDGGAFILYLADQTPSTAPRERVIRLDLREALIWLNEPVPQRESLCD